MKECSEDCTRGVGLARLAHEDGEPSGLDLANAFCAQIKLLSDLRERMRCVLEDDEHAQNLLLTWSSPNPGDCFGHESGHISKIDLRVGVQAVTDGLRQGR
ncbi:hypothetical protein ASG45_13170 [Microbacterium sp. Leaf436]|nr:hypothetical protein ASG45_13170 [Microbacterium sp. Leaf436]